MSEQLTQKTLSQEVTDVIHDATGMFPDWDGESQGYLRTYSHEEAGQMLGYLQDWLPATLVEATGEPSDENIATKQDIFTYDDIEDTVWHRLTQEWGHKPEPTDLKANGPIIEVGGPTANKEGSLDFTYGVSPDIVSNVVTTHGDKDLELDMLADGANLPLPAESVGTVFASCIPGAPRERSQFSPTLRDDILTEAARVLKPGGRVVWSGGTPRDIDTLSRLGFVPEYMKATSTISENLVNGDYTYPSLSFIGSFVKAPTSAT